MIDLRPLFHPSFWFDLFPQALSPLFERAFFLLFAGLIILGAVVRIVARNSDRYERDTLDIVKRVARMMSVMGLIGLVWFFFSFEEIYLVGARFWFLLWGIGLIVWIAMLVRYVKVVLPRKQHARAEETEGKKYLPRTNRR